jgi:hypothetical protein
MLVGGIVVEDRVDCPAGGDLGRAGLDVTFIEQWPAHAEAVWTNGAWVVMPDETLVTPVRAVDSGGSVGLDEGPLPRRRISTTIVVREQRRLGRCAPVNEALIAIAVRIESGVLPPEVGARG